MIEEVLQAQSTMGGDLRVYTQNAKYKILIQSRHFVIFPVFSDFFLLSLLKMASFEIFIKITIFNTGNKKPFIGKEKRNIMPVV